jgi:hypothetical protein
MDLKRDIEPMSKSDVPESFGVFKPVGHVVVAFAQARDMQGAADALLETGFDRRHLVRYTPQEMLAQVDREIGQAGVLASLGQEMNLAKSHRELAERGYCFLVVFADRDGDADRVAEIARRFNAERAQKYNAMLIEELL